MKCLVVWGIATAASAVMGVMCVAQAATGVEVAGGSGLIGFDSGGERTAVLLSTFSTNPTVLTFTTADDLIVLPLSLTQLNSTAAAWQGLAFSLRGASFAGLPAPTFGGLPGTVFGVGDDQAQLLFAAVPGTFKFVDLNIDLDQGSQAELTITPIVPEPATGAVLLTTLLLGCRRVRG